MTNKLLVRPNPFLGESLVGYIARLTECNGYETITEVLSLLPNFNNYVRRNDVKPYQFYNPSFELLERLAALTQKDLEIPFDLVTFPYFKKQLGSNSVLSVNNMIYQNTYKFCGLCLREEAYHRKIWDLMIVSVCPIHNCLLHYNCPSCKKTLKLSQGAIYKCRCNFDFRETEPIFISEDETKIVRYVYVLAGLLKSENMIISSECPLINYPLRDFCNIIYYYTKRIFRIHSGEKFYFKKVIEQNNLHQLVCEAFRIFDNFPANYIEYLEKLVKNSNYLKSRNWFNYFAANYDDFFIVMPGGFSSLLYKVFNEHIDKILFRNNIKTSQANFTSSITASELANQLDLKTEEVMRLVLNGNLKSRIYQKQKRDDLYLFDGDTFYKTMNRIRSKMKPISRKKEQDVMNLTQIIQYLSQHGVKLHQFLNLVLQGKINSCFEDYNAKGLSRYLFSENDIKRLDFKESNFRKD